MMTNTTGPLLEVEQLQVTFRTPGGPLHAVDGISFSLAPRDALGIVGESGSGKSVTALTLLRLFSRTSLPSIRGKAYFEGRDLLTLPDAELRRVRGGQIGMIFQDPLTSLNPVMPIGEQIMETLRLHQGLSAQAARRRTIDLLGMVGIPAAASRIDDLPHHFSGGMRQRIMIAIAIACEPKLLIADEPTTALDVTIQAQILALLDRLRHDLGMALIMISHDIGVVAATCDRVQVMYAGRIVESGPVARILHRPEHPYTRGLMRSIPRIDLPRHNRLRPIPGQPAFALNLPAGCRFANRCQETIAHCHYEEPPLLPIATEHYTACWQTESAQLAAAKR